MLLGRAELVAVIDDFSALVRRDESLLNELNVFPVADADTGTNLRRTTASLAAAVSGTDDLESARAAIRVSALDGRGNSGLIIGQYLTGFVEPLTRPADSMLLGRCVAAAATAARRAVVSPVEGTILSVADAVADAVMAALDASSRHQRPLRNEELVDILVTNGQAALARTTDQLDVLAEAGVVDSGAAGLMLFFEALKRVISGVSVPIEGGAHPGAVGVDVDDDVDERATRLHEPRVVGHEIQLRVGRDLADAATLRACLTALGTDVVIAEQGNELAGHVHVQDLGEAITAIETTLGAEPGQIRFAVEPLLERGR